MAGYTRQSTFADGDTITAALFNNEYNQLVNAFSNTSGHKHDGTASEGPVIGLIGDAGLTTPLNKVLIDTVNNYIEFYVDVASSSVQQLYIADGAIVPVTDNDIDLGTSSLEFKDLYLDGTATIDTLTVDEAATIGTTLGVTGATTLSSTLGVTGATTLSSTLGVTGAATLSSTLAVTGTSTLTGNVTASNDLSVGGNLTVTGNATISGNLTFGDADTDSITLTADVASNIVPDVDDTYDLGTATKQWRNLYIDGTAEVDTLSIDGTAVTSTAAELNILDGVTATAAEINTLDGITATVAELNILDGVTSTATELNIVDGDTLATATTLADADRVVVNDAGVMKQVALTDFETYFEGALDTLSNVTTVGVLNAGSITSGFGAIDNGSSNITTTGTVTYGSLSDGVITITAFADEDDMVSNSATLVPTQQSVKAYVDAQVATANELSELTDVNLTTPADASLLFYDTTTSKWIDNVVSGDITIADTGVATIAAGSVENSMLAGSIANDKLSNSSVSYGGVSVSLGGSDATPAFNLSDATAYPGDSSLVTTGALNSGSITSGFGSIDVGSSAITTTGTVTGGTLAGTLATAAQPNITSLGTLTGLITTGNLTIGTEDNNSAILEISGAATGSAEGGELRLDTAADYDGTYEFYRIDVAEDDFRIGRQGQTDFTLFSDGTAQFHGNLTATLATAAQTNITSVGTLSSLTVSGDLTVDTDTLFVDASEDAVGIGGVSNLNQTLNVFGTPNDTIDETAGTVKFETTGGNGLLFGTQSSSPYRSYIQSAYVLDTSLAQYDLLLNPLGGNVGIGLTSPALKLHIVTSTDGDGISIQNSSTAATTAKQPRLTLTGTDTVGTAKQAALIQATPEDNNYVGAGLGIHTRSGDSVTEKVRIDGSGNVGIGTTDPDKLLHLAAGTGATLRLESTTTGATTGDIFGAIEFETQDSNSAGVKGKIDSYSEGAVGNGALRFFTGNTTELGERMRIDSSGNVGINTTNPDYILNTNYNAPATFTNAASDFTQMWQNSGTNALGVALSDDLVARLVTNNSYEFAIGSSTTEQLRIDGGGRVGIGTDSPESKFNVHSGGSTFSSGTLPAGMTLYGNTTDGQGSMLSFKAENGDQGIAGIAGLRSSGYQTELRFYTNNTNSQNAFSERMRIDSSGNVGIAAVPSGEAAAAHVVRLGDRVCIAEYDDGSNPEQFNLFHNSDSSETYIETGPASVIQQRAGEISFKNAASGTAGAGITFSERMRIDSSGNAYFNRTSELFNNDGVLIGNSNGGYIYAERSDAGNSILYVHRRANDGNLIDFYQGNSLEGNITVSGTTVSYNGFSGTHDSSGIGVSSSTQVGTVLSTIDEEHKANHAKVKISDIEGDVRVYGVLQEYKEEQTNSDTGITSAEHAVVASVGIGSVLVTGACNGGDLLESNGDGTAKVQSDDIIRSKTIGKVTIGNSDAGVKLVSCVLYCG